MPEFIDRLPGLHDPVTTRLLLPIAVAFVLTGLLRVAGGPRGRAVAGAAVVIAVLVVHSIVVGVPALPPMSAADKLGWLVMAGLGLGLLLDLLRPHRSIVWAVIALWPGVIIGWIGLTTVLSIPRLAEGSPRGALEGLALITACVGFWIAGSAALDRLRSTDGASAAIMLLAAAVALGFVLLRTGNHTLGGITLALASATGGFLLWNLGRSRHPVGGSVVLGGGTVLLAIGAIFGFFSGNAVALVVLALLCAVFFAERTARGYPLGRGVARFAAPLVLGAVAAIPTLAAVAVAILAL